jgi:hypothetical protein
MPLNRRLWRPGIRPPSVVPRTLYFDGSDDDNWFNLSNWWNDENHTEQAESLPRSVDSVVVTNTDADTTQGSEPTVANFTMNDTNQTDRGPLGPLTVTGIAVFNGYSGNFATPLNGNAVFNDDSFNASVINGNVTFNGMSFTNPFGEINGNAVFNDDTFNDSPISGDAVFNGFSQHNFGATIGGNATFNNSATNEGAVLGDATFNDNSRHVGSVTGTATFNDSSCVDGGVAGTFVPDDPVNCNDI